MSRGAGAIRVSLETGSRLSFASALDWPGWSRSGRGDEAAVEALRAYAPRYAPVAADAGLEPPDPAQDRGRGAARRLGNHRLRGSRRHRAAGRRAAHRARGGAAGRASSRRAGRSSTGWSPAHRPSCARGPAAGGGTATRSSTTSSAPRWRRTRGSWASGSRGRPGMTWPRGPVEREAIAAAAASGGRGSALGAGSRRRAGPALRRPADRLARARSRLGDRGPERLRSPLPQGASHRSALAVSEARRARGAGGAANSRAVGGPWCREPVKDICVLNRPGG